MTAIAITTNITGTPDIQDKNAYAFAIAKANQGRAIPLPSSTNNERKASYEIILAEKSLERHLANIENAQQQADLDAAFREYKSAYLEATPQKRADSLAAATSALQ